MKYMLNQTINFKTKIIKYIPIILIYIININALKNDDLLYLAKDNNKKIENKIFKYIIKNKNSKIKKLIDIDKNNIQKIIKIQNNIAKFINNRIHFDIDQNDFQIVDIINKKLYKANIIKFIKSIEQKYKKVKEDRYEITSYYEKRLIEDSIKYNINMLWLYILEDIDIKLKNNDITDKDHIKLAKKIAKFLIDINGTIFDKYIYNKIKDKPIDKIKYLITFNNKSIATIYPIIKDKGDIFIIKHNIDRIKSIAKNDFI
jgi:hypothetical protein